MNQKLKAVAIHCIFLSIQFYGLFSYDDGNNCMASFLSRGLSKNWRDSFNSESLEAPKTNLLMQGELKTYWSASPVNERPDASHCFFNAMAS